MKLGKWIFLFTFPAVIFVSLTAEAQGLKPIIGWRYIPVQAELWGEFTKNMEASAYKAALQNAADISELAKDPSEISEAHLAKAKALSALGYFQAAFYLYTDIIQTAPNSFAANESLVDLSSLLQTHSSFDEELLSRAINRSTPVELPEAAVSMASFYLALDHLKSGHMKWGKDFVHSVAPENHWGHRLAYFNALELVKDKKPDQALQNLEALVKDENVSSNLKELSRIQMARLYFEKTDFPAAEKLYASLQPSNRNTGRLLYERAWNQYYLKDYSLTLGMLESLKAPFFTPAIEPEQYVLSSIVLRDLCHYPEVKKINTQFFEVFNPVIKYIRSGRPLTKNRTLLSMALVREPFRTPADVVDLIQKEERQMKSELGETDLTRPLIRRYATVEREIKGRLDHELDRPIRFEADRLLQIADQMKLLDYVSGLDENRIQGIFESRGYKADKPDTVRFNTLYWPLRKPAQAPVVSKTEYWFDELTTLRVLISDRCQGAM